MKNADIDIAVSGKYWIGSLAGSILTAFRETAESAKDEVQITVYSFGKNIPEFVKITEDLLQKKIRIQLVVNRFFEQPRAVIDKLLKLQEEYENLTLLNFNPLSGSEDLHAKIMVVDRTWAIVGSSNISWHGYVSNHELVIIIRGELAEGIAKLIDKIARSPVTSIVQND